jgi:uncharacterized protein YceH (UPF0502 family)
MSMSTSEPAATSASEAPKHRPLSSRQRRVLGVLIEKAKTTPDAYPMTLNAIVAGSNQKSNREPQMNLAAEDVEQVLDELRALGAVTEVQGSGRVAKYRHHGYEWLGVDKTEIAVMTELLLRGEQTLGELRGRAARMDPIPDLAALKVVVDALLQRGLMIEITPAGRGQIVSHNLYKDREIGELKAQHAGHIPAGDADSPPAARPVTAHVTHAAAASSPGIRGVTADQFAELEVEMAELRAEISRLRERVASVEAKLA